MSWPTRAARVSSNVSLFRRRAMSFDIFCIAYKNRERALGNAEAALAILRSHGAQSGSDAWFALEFSDGAGLAVHADGLTDARVPFEHAMFNLHGSSLANMQFIYDFAEAARLIIFPQDPPQAILPFEELRADVPSGFLRDPKPIVVHNGHELGLVISGRMDELAALSKPR